MSLRRIIFSLLATALILSGCSVQREAAPPVEEDRQTFALQSVLTRYEARLNEDGTMPENAIMRAKAQRDEMLDAQRELDAGGIFPASWTWVGPGNIGGRLRAIIVHPTQPNIIWVGTVGGGIWKTTNSGTTWSPMDDFMATISIGCMAMTPTNPDVLYAGTGEGFFESVEGSSNTAAILGAGIFKSMDGGLTWDQLPPTAGWKYINRMAVHPTNGNTVWAATKVGIFKSLDGGTSWSLKLAGDFLDLQLDPNNPNKLVANKSHIGVYYSTNGGDNWTQATGIAGHRVELAYAPNTPDLVYGAQCNNDRVLVYRSTNGGQTFTLQTSGTGIPMYAIYNVTIWVDPTNPNRLVVGGVNLFRSTDGGVTFGQTFNAVHADMHTIVSHPGFNGTTNKTVYVGCDGGIYRITDAYASAATRINNNISLTQFYGGAVNDTTGVVLAGAQDNGTNRFTTNPLQWNENVIGGDGAYCASDPTNSAVWYGATQYQAIRRSTNGGTSFSSVAPPGAGSSNNYNFIPYFMLDPNESNRMLACGELLWRSNNIRTGTPPTWASIKPSIRSGGRPGGDGGSNTDRGGQAHFTGNNPWNISTVAAAIGNSDLIWVGHNNGSLYKTVNGTAGTPTWTKMDTNPPGLPDRWISRIVIDKNDHNRVYVSFLGWAPNNVWRTTDGGANWTQITGSGPFTLPAAPVGAFAAHRAKPGWLYAGTDIGIFTSSDDGQTWTTSTDGPGTVPIDELVWRNDNVLMAVTHGRGVYFATINPNEEPFAPASFIVAGGTLLSGRLQELFFSDNRYVEASSSITSRFVIEFTGVSPVPGPTGLQFNVESRLSLSGGIQLIDLFNYSTNQWARVSTIDAPTADTMTTVTAPGNGADFIEPGTRRVKTRVTYVSGLGNRLWTASFDQVYWKALP